MLQHATHLCIMTNNTNTFNIFGLLSDLPAYNHILISAINVILKNKIDLCVVHIPGAKIVIVDTLS